LVSSLMILGEESGGVDLTANFLVVRTMQDGDMAIFAAGRYIDRIERRDDAWKFARKDVVLDSRRIDTLLAIPL
jgi:3-phenylpropionate/cinnamic acid dioxygenase small subunit